ncbi:hypothetical protein [Spirulina sp. 06S082]|uniref:hypothetical protein n=1 Tax=Spirulina sp. 06S082 TaxID=3110248 RepID=UPI002B20507A|nr:hypothetical protein [Spirulina sp. 06S082]MEA5472504.1 hypothetical protein [Spirulina sp. 06S082]
MNAPNSPHLDPLEQEEIDREEEREIAGYDPDRPLELDAKYRLALDEEQPPPQPVEERGFPRAIFVTAGVGGFLLALLGIWLVVKPRSPEIAQPKLTPDPTPTVTEKETDYNAKVALALQGQEIRELEEEPTPQPSPSPKIEVREAPPKPAPQPPPRIQSAPPPRTTVTRAAPPQPERSRSPAPVDPHDRWNQLAALGQVQTTPPELPPATVTEDLPAEPPKSAIANVDLNSNSDKELSPGAQGILTRNRSTAANAPTRRAIAFGKTAPATISVPLLWDEGSGEQLYNRFAVTLSQDVIATDNQSVALPKETVLVAEAQLVGKDNRFVQASAIAVIFKDSRGEIQQQSLPANAILIRGEEGDPLIAQEYFDRGSETAARDILTSVLSGIGRIGEVFTEPERISTFSGSGSTSSSSTTIRSREPQIWSAVLDGFFNPLADRLSQRSDARLQAMLEKANIAVIPVGTKVTISVNSMMVKIVR